MKLPNKWQFAIGTTSRVPNSGGLHYLIVDFDEDAPNFKFLHQLDIKNAILQRTEHGWHVYTDMQLEFHTLVNVLSHMLRADKVWIEIGKKRGYYFLADKSRIVFPWKVEHMVIYHDKEKARNTRASGSLVQAKGN
jgi:hypothetical protein